MSNQLGVVTGQLGSDYEYCTTCYKVEESLNGFKDNLWPPTITGYVPKAWIGITLPESIVIQRIKAYTYEVTVRTMCYLVLSRTTWNLNLKNYSELRCVTLLL